MRTRAASFAVLAVAAVAAGTLGDGNAATIDVQSDHISTFSAPGPTTVPSDTTAPTAAFAAFDDDHDGRIERITADFDEPLGPACTATAWTVGHGTTAYTPTASAPAAGDVVTLSLGTQLPVDTATTSLTVSLTEGANGYCDEAGNQATVAAAQPADRARPLLTSVTSANGGSTAGRLEVNDTVTFGFTEAMAVPNGGVSAVSIARINQSAGQPRISVDVPGLVAQPSDVPSSYVAPGTGPATLGATVTATGRQLVVRATSGTCPTGTCTTGASATFTVVPAPLLDLAGQTSWTTSLTVTVRLF